MVKSKIKKTKSKHKNKKSSNVVDPVIKVLPAVIITAGAIGLVSGLLSSKRTSTQSVS